MVHVTFQRVYFVSQPFCWGVQGAESGWEISLRIKKLFQ